VDCCQVVAGEFVVTGGDATEVFQSAETAFDGVTAFVEGAVQATTLFAVRLKRDDRFCAGVFHQFAEGVAVIAFVRDQGAHGWRDRKNVGRSFDVVHVAAGEHDRVGATQIVAQGMDFRRAPAAGATDSLRLVPPFAPLAERCALIDVESSESTTRSVPQAAKASKIAFQRPAFDQRLKRL
jgi:hypothetical protein